MSDLIRKSWLTVALALLLPGGAVVSSRAAVSGMTTLSGPVSSLVSQLQPLGLLPAATNLNLAIGLPLRNRESLTNLLREIYDPASPNYHHYLTPAEFTAQFGPTEQDYQAVINFAQQNGLTVAATHPNRVVLDVTGPAANIQQAFHVTLRTYYDTASARSFFAPNVAPTVDGALPILNVSGLDNYFIPKPRIKPTALAGSIIPNAGTGPFGTYQGSDFRNAYVPGTTLTGAGQNVGLLQFDGFYASDVAAYAAQIGLSTVPNLIVVPINGGVPVPTPFGNPEVSLDIDMILSISPGVSNIYVYEAPNPSPWVSLLSRMANDNLAKQLSCSWGGGPPDAVAEQIFQQMAVQGQSFFSASGDFDAFNISSNPIEFPSDSPHITQVGGTTLTTGAGARYASETVWNRGFDPLSGQYVGSSGGISTTYAIPTWQTNINVAASKGSATMRNIPDVALTGENVWVIYGSGNSGSFGGTSAAAPLWAGFTALVNQQAASSSHAPVGFVNPALYAIASGPNYTNCFHDTTTGNNTNSGSANLFFAVTNYDLCTGLGTPTGTNLINALTAAGVNNPITHLSPPPPPYGSTLSTLNGGNPNGTWMLFIQDDAMIDSGAISNGWVLALTTANPVGFAANLVLSMSASPTNTLVGGTVVYTLGVTNYGPSTSSNIVVSDSLPLGAFLLATNQTQGSVSRSGSQVIWNVGTLTNAGAQLTLTVQVTSGGVLENFAFASAETPDPNTSDNSVSAVVNAIVPAPAVLSNASVSNGVFHLTVTGTPGINYTIQASTNLVNWLSIWTNMSPFLFTDPYASNYPTRFYRTIGGP